jgi:GNAT superfamily N-acetyltransferase
MTDVEIVPLDESHDVSAFSSGEESLDQWLKRHALANQAAHSSRTFVLIEPGSPKVWGYYSLTVATIERSEVTKGGRSGMPQSYDIPAVLLARLARDDKRRDEGYGQLLLADAVLRTLRMAQDAGIRLLAVHALNERARQWYLSHDFQPSPIDDRLLMLTVPDLLATWEDSR